MIIKDCELWFKKENKGHLMPFQKKIFLVIRVHITTVVDRNSKTSKLPTLQAYSDRLFDHRYWKGIFCFEQKIKIFLLLVGHLRLSQPEDDLYQQLPFSYFPKYFVLKHQPPPWPGTYVLLVIWLMERRRPYTLKQTEKMEHLFVIPWMSKNVERRSVFKLHYWDKLGKL